MTALAVTEAAFTAQVLDAARIFRWRTAHFRPARTATGWRTPVAGDGVGFPDLVLLRGPRLVVAELKSAHGTLGPGQQEWLDAFQAAGAEIHIWRPGDLDYAIEVLKVTDRSK